MFINEFSYCKDIVFFMIGPSIFSAVAVQIMLWLSSWLIPSLFTSCLFVCLFICLSNSPPFYFSMVLRQQYYKYHNYEYNPISLSIYLPPLCFANNSNWANVFLRYKNNKNGKRALKLL